MRNIKYNNKTMGNNTSRYNYPGVYNDNGQYEEDSRYGDYILSKKKNKIDTSSYHIEFEEKEVNAVYNHPILGFVADILEKLKPWIWFFIAGLVIKWLLNTSTSGIYMFLLIAEIVCLWVFVAYLLGIKPIKHFKRQVDVFRKMDRTKVYSLQAFDFVTVFAMFIICLYGLALLDSFISNAFLEIQEIFAVYFVLVAILLYTFEMYVPAEDMCNS